MFADMIEASASAEQARGTQRVNATTFHAYAILSWPAGNEWIQRRRGALVRGALVHGALVRGALVRRPPVPVICLLVLGGGYARRIVDERTTREEFRLRGADVVG